VAESTSAPQVALPVPRGWVDGALAPPDLSQTALVRVISFRSWRPAGELSQDASQASLVAACLGGDPGTWADDLEPLVLNHLRAVISSTGLRTARVGDLRVLSTERSANVMRQDLAGTGEAEGKLAARLFLGFAERTAERPELVGCFALCAGDARECEPSVRQATVDAVFVPRPPASLALRAVLGMVHHPSASLAGALSLALVLGAVLVLTRRRPRAK
jgi:hypothetical protein